VVEDIKIIFIEGSEKIIKINILQLIKNPQQKYLKNGHNALLFLDNPHD